MCHVLMYVPIAEDEDPRMRPGYPAHLATRVSSRYVSQVPTRARGYDDSRPWILTVSVLSMSTYSRSYLLLYCRAYV